MVTAQGPVFGRSFAMHGRLETTNDFNLSKDS